VNVSAKFAVRGIAFAIWVGLQTPNLGEGEAIRGKGWYCSKERL